jgi:hypothetical protein
MPWQRHNARGRPPLAGDSFQRNTIKRSLRLSPQVETRLLQIQEMEGRPAGDIVNTLVLLGIGVYAKMREHPELKKARIFDHTPLAELLLLADRSLLLGIANIADSEAQRWVDSENERRRSAPGKRNGI